jgi:hypothetical protein
MINRDISDISQRHPRFTKITMRNTADMTRGKVCMYVFKGIQKLGYDYRIIIRNIISVRSTARQAIQL